MAVLSVQDVVISGLAPSYASAAGGGDSFVMDGNYRHFIHVKNGGGAPINVTLTAIMTSIQHPDAGPLTVADRVVSVPNAGERMIGPIPSAFRNSAGSVAIAYSAVTSVTIGVFKLPVQP